jgi:type IV pilus assembly protein PilX
MSKAMNNPTYSRNLKKYSDNYRSIKIRPQRGAVLVISLIMLLLMTLIGTTGMQATSLEEKMAGNMRNRNLAFQAAEAALAAGESFLATRTVVQLNALNADANAFNCTGADGLFPQSGTGCAANLPIWNNEKPIWENINWNADSVLYDGNLATVETNPRYIIENMGCRKADGSVAPVCGAVGDNRVYRITARATGGTADAVAMVQSIYEIPF